MLSSQEREALSEVVRRGLASSHFNSETRRREVIASIVLELEKAAGPMKWRIDDQVRDREGRVWSRIAPDRWVRGIATRSSDSAASDYSVEGWVATGVAHVITTGGS